MICSKCQTKNPDGSKFCSNCSQIFPPTKEQLTQIQNSQPESISNSTNTQNARPSEEVKAGPSKAIIAVALVASIMILVIVVLMMLLPMDTAKNNPQVREFLSQHPNAAVSFSNYPVATLKLDKNFWNANCSPEIAEEDYYFLKAIDGNSIYQALFNKGDMNIICSVNKTNGTIENNNIIPIEEKINETPVSINFGKTPLEIYLEYKFKFDKMQNFSDYKSLLLTYADQETISKISSTESMQQSQLDELVTTMLSISPKLFDINAQSVKEDSNDDSASLLMTAKNETLYGKVIFTKESNVWKIKKELWSQDPITITQNEDTQITCTESWTCTDWTNCDKNMQTRVCSDSNNCGFSPTKIELKPCTTQ